MTPVAGIDCGTNSIRLLISEGGVDLVREMRIVRLGQDVDRTGRLAPEAIERTRLALLDYAALIDTHGASDVRMVATSATRDAANRQDFVRMVHGLLGVEPGVITGIEEAALSFAGAVGGLPELNGRLLVADIGGGSTELVLGTPGTTELSSYSMDVGCVRMTERHLRDDPPTPAQIEATVSDLRTAITRAALEVPITTADTFVGVAGTVTTLVAIVLGLEQYRADVIHGASITAEQVREVTARLLTMTRTQRLTLPVMHPGRADVIGGGALVLRTLMEATGAPAVIASEHDILDGIAASIAVDPV
jgi:exopolyphosphatase/guanosine-5'-triphosphate,3'-diphosphate pyrophosphatase